MPESGTATTFRWQSSDAIVCFEWSENAPVSLTSISVGSPLRVSLVGSRPVVDLFTSDEQRARTSQSYIQSAVGERLRFVSLDETGDRDSDRLEIVQEDPFSRLRVVTRVTKPHRATAWRFVNTVINVGTGQIVVTALTSAVLGIGRSEEDLDSMTLVRGESEWLAEGRWHEGPLRDSVPRLALGLHGQDGRGRFAVTSHGAWPTGENLPVGVVADEATNTTLAWQLESGTAWQWSIGQGRDGAFLSLVGPADLEHHFAHDLPPGATFDAAPAAIVVADGGADVALAQLTAYRRFLRGELRPAEKRLPVIYNDFMNTLMGDPSTEKLAPLIDQAAAVGVELFCVDAGWFADEGDWWDSVGEWVENSDRFTGGFAAVTERIRDRGMLAGTWLEPEVVGENSRMARALPDEAFFQRFGVRVKEHGRYHLDFRHPAAVAHLDEVVDRLVRDYGISYLKLDYNINPGAGTDLNARAPGDGLLGHSRAFVEWMRRIQQRHPELLIENCSSGAMRMDYALLAHSHLQSTSDQQDYRLYPVISASAPMSIIPEQAANWAYPSVQMSDAETVFSLVSGLPGRLYLSGFLDLLRPTQTALVAEAVAFAKDWRQRLAESTPFWPIGLPSWHDESIVVGFHCEDDTLLFVWSRHDTTAELRIDGSYDDVTCVYPHHPPVGDEWALTALPGHLVVNLPAGCSARVLRARRRSARASS